jgi:hypothetical protein
LHIELKFQNKNLSGAEALRSSGALFVDSPLLPSLSNDLKPLPNSIQWFIELDGNL